MTNHNLTITDLGVHVDTITNQRVTAHKVTETKPIAFGPATFTTIEFLTVPEKHPDPCFGRDMELGMWEPKGFQQRFTRTCNT